MYNIISFSRLSASSFDIFSQDQDEKFNFKFYKKWTYNNWNTLALGREEISICTLYAVFVRHQWWSVLIAVTSGNKRIKIGFLEWESNLQLVVFEARAFPVRHDGFYIKHLHSKNLKIIKEYFIHYLQSSDSILVLDKGVWVTNTFSRIAWFRTRRSGRRLSKVAQDVE